MSLSLVESGSIAAPRDLPLSAELTQYANNMCQTPPGHQPVAFVWACDGKTCAEDGEWGQPTWLCWYGVLTTTCTCVLTIPVLVCSPKEPLHNGDEIGVLQHKGENSVQNLPFGWTFKKNKEVLTKWTPVLAAPFFFFYRLGHYRVGHAPHRFKVIPKTALISKKDWRRERIRGCTSQSWRKQSAGLWWIDAGSWSVFWGCKFLETLAKMKECSGSRFCFGFSLLTCHPTGTTGLSVDHEQSYWCSLHELVNSQSSV